MGIGEKLKNERIKQGYSLQEVEEDTKIRKYYLDALENDNYEVLPPKVYATGFVRRYAKFLGLDEGEYVEIFKQVAYGDDSHQELPPIQAPSTKDFPRSISWQNVLVALVFLVAVIWVGDYLVAYFTKEHSIPPNHIQQPVVEQPQQEEEKPADNIISSPEETGVKIVIEANQDCWLNVIVDNETQYNATLVAGEKLTFSGDDKVYVKAGNAGGIKIIYNGEEMSPLGNSGEVKEATYTPF